MTTMSRTKEEIKGHKGAKVTSWTIIGGVAAVLFITLVITLIPLITKRNDPVDNGVMKVTAPIEQTRRNQVSGSSQPIASKIEPQAVGESMSSATEAPTGDYSEFWERLDGLATDAGATPGEARVTFYTSFLLRLGFWSSGEGQPVFVKDTQSPVSPETLACYLNAYVPDKNHIKPNCPSK